MELLSNIKIFEAEIIPFVEIGVFQFEKLLLTVFVFWSDLAEDCASLWMDEFVVLEHYEHRSMKTFHMVTVLLE
jgi:hypothetical protein